MLDSVSTFGFIFKAGNHLIENLKLCAHVEDEDGQPVWLEVTLLNSGECLVEFCNAAIGGGMPLFSLQCSLDILMDPVRGHKVQLSGANGSCQLVTGNETLCAEVRTNSRTNPTRSYFELSEYQSALNRLRVSRASTLL